MKPNLFSSWFVDRAVNWSATTMLICACNGFMLVTFMKAIPETMFTVALFNTLLLTNLTVLILSLAWFLCFVLYGIRKYT